MKRFSMLALATACAVGLGAAAATAKETIKYAYLLEPAMEGVLHAIKSGKVTSDKIDLEMEALAIPALIQSTPTKRYDVIMNAVLAIPLAKQRGLDLTVLSVALRSPEAREGGGIWVMKDSPFKTLADLKGKTIGNFALQSTGTTWIRIGLWRKHGFNVAYEGGDFNWVQMPAPALLGALESGRVDAATLIHSQAFIAEQSGNFRVLTETNADVFAVYGVDTVSAVNVTYPEKLAEKPEAFAEFNRMLKASVDYALANPDEVGAAIAQEGKLSPEFFKAWLTRYSFFPGTVRDKDLKAIEVVWENAKEMGMFKEYPAAASVVWDRAIRE